MNRNVQLSLKAGERVFINGAVLKADGRVSLELLNDATYLVEEHILQPADTTTPLKQLYFVLQTIVMAPDDSEEARRMFEVMHVSVLLAFANETVRAGLMDMRALVAKGRLVEALHTVRSLFPIEDDILGRNAEPRLLEAV